MLSDKPEVYLSFFFLLSLHVAEKRTNRAQVGSLNTAVLLIAWSWMASGYKTKPTWRLWVWWEGLGSRDVAFHLPRQHTRTRPPSSPSHMTGQFWKLPLNSSHHYREHCADWHRLADMVVVINAWNSMCVECKYTTSQTFFFVVVVVFYKCS